MKTDTNIINNMKEPRKILMPHGATAKLGDALGVSQPTVRKALRYEENQYNSEEVSLARKIRYAAVKNFGGMDTGEPDMQTTEDGSFWEFENGARLTLNFRTGEATISREGKVIDRTDKILLSAIPDWKLKAENLV